MTINSVKKIKRKNVIVHTAGRGLASQSLSAGTTASGGLLETVNQNKSNVIYEECVCRCTPSIGIVTTRCGLNYDVKLGHHLL